MYPRAIKNTRKSVRSSRSEGNFIDNCLRGVFGRDKATLAQECTGGIGSNTFLKEASDELRREIKRQGQTE